MNEPNEKIQLDDITFDDVIGGDGVETVDTPKEELEVVENELEELELEDPKDEDLEDDDEYEDEDEDDNDEYEDEEEDEDEYESEYDDSDDPAEQPTVINEILDSLGYDANDSYDDTAEGLTKMTKDIASKMADDRIDDVLASFPLVKQHLEYVLHGGESKEFMSAHDPAIDYGAFTVGEEDSRSQRMILSNYLKLKGHDKEFSDELLEDYEDSGKLYQKSLAAQKALTSYQEKEREQMITNQRASQEKSNQSQREFWNGIADKIDDSDEFAGVRLAESEKNGFFNYLSQPVDKNGSTQRDVDHRDADMDVKLAIDYLMYKGFDLESLVNTRAKTAGARSLRDKISRSEASVKSARKASRRNKKFDIDDLDLSI